MRNEYYLIVQQCAPKISKHFTKITQVINEGNSYEFPSVDIHKAVILRLIFNDQEFCKLIQHISNGYRSNEALLKKKHPKFCTAFDMLQ